jgi:hypothetical protein
VDGLLSEREASRESSATKMASKANADVLVAAYGDMTRVPVAELIKAPDAVWSAVMAQTDPTLRTARADAVAQAVREAFMRPAVAIEVQKRFQSDHFAFLEHMLSICLSGSASALPDLTAMIIRRAQWGGIAAVKGFKTANKFLLEVEGIPGLRDLAFEKAVSSSEAESRSFSRRSGKRGRSYGGFKKFRGGFSKDKLKYTSKSGGSVGEKRGKLGQKRQSEGKSGSDRESS